MTLVHGFRRAPWLMPLCVALPLAASHPKDVSAALEKLVKGDSSAAMAPFQDEASKPGARNRILYLYELAAFHRWSGEFQKSAQCFLDADACVRERDQEAVISAGRTLQNAAATVINDTVRTYDAPPHERVMSRTLNAMNYLLLGHLEEALVETRKAEEYQKLERERHEKAIQAAKESTRVKATMAQGSLQTSLKTMDTDAAGLRNSYENAFTYFLASQMYLAQGPEGINDAWIEIQHALEMAQGHAAVQTAYLDIAARQGPDVLQEAAAHLGLQAATPNPQTPRVVVCFESGMVPPKSEVKVNVPLGQWEVPMAFPVYKRLQPPGDPLECGTGPQLHPTERILDLRHIAVKALLEQMYGIVSRQIMGAIVKIKSQDAAEAHYGTLGALSVKAAAESLTMADQRSWLTLPGDVQIALLDLRPGPNLLTFRTHQWEEQIEVEGQPGMLCFVSVRSIGKFHRIDMKSYGHQIGASHDIQSH